MLLLCRSSSIPQLWLAGNNWGDSGVSRSRVFFPFLPFPSPCGSISFTRLCSILHWNHPHPSWPHGHERSLCVSMHTPFLFFYFFYSFIEQTVPVLSLILGRLSTFVPPPPTSFPYVYSSGLCLRLSKLSPADSDADLLLSCALNTFYIVFFCLVGFHGTWLHFTRDGRSRNLFSSPLSGWLFWKSTLHMTQQPHIHECLRRHPKLMGAYTALSHCFLEPLWILVNTCLHLVCIPSGMLWRSLISCDPGCCSATTVVPVSAFVAMFFSAIFSLHSLCLWLLLKSISTSSSQFQNSRSEVD